MPGDLNVSELVGGRFRRNVRDVLNVIEAVEKVPCAELCGLP